MVQYKGLDCLKDMELDAYMDYHTQLQASVPWASQVYYGYYTIYFGCAFVIVALLKHVHYRYRDWASRKNGTSNGLTLFVDTLVSYGRFVGYKQVPAKISYYTSLPPSVGSTLFLTASTLYLSLYCLVPHFWYRGCRGFGSPPLAVRAGIMATALTPFLYVLAGKANMLTLVTGISYEKLNYIHQYVGVAALVLSLIHTIPFLWQPLHEGGLSNLREEFLSDLLYQNGIPPLILLVLLCTLSKAGIRKRAYETFWHLHWIMGVLYMGTLGYHIWDELETENYIYAALAFWGTQVIYRVLVKTCFKPNALFLRPTEAQLFKLEGSNAFQVNVKNRGISWKPGQHVYVRFKSRILDNHPFSICNLPNEEDDDLKFIIVPKRGLTGSLYAKLDESLKEKAYLDGPYGGTARDHNSFDKVFLFTTGSGISATLPFLTDLSQKIISGANKLTTEVHFVWIVRRPEDIDWCRVELERAAECEGVFISVYVCHTDDEKSSSDSSKSLNSDSKISDSKIGDSKMIEKPSGGLKIFTERPNVPVLLKSFAPSLGRKNFLCVSGSDKMKLQVCSAASDFQSFIFNRDLNSSVVEEVYLHTESFGW